MRTHRWLAGLALITGLWGPAQAAALPPGVDFSARQLLPGNTHPQAQADSFVSAADAALPMERITLALRANPTRQAALAQFLVDQHDPASPEFHRWLTPEAFGARFGPAPADVAQAASWLASQGLVVHEVARSGMWLQFSGTAGSVQRAFQTPINHYVVDGQFRVANAQDPTIPVALREVVAGPVTLHNVASQSMAARLEPQYTGANGGHALAPGDFAAIYNLAPLYAAGVDGAGQSIAIVGRTRPSTANWAGFRATYGLPPNAPQVIVNGPDPGDLGAAENGEADLDVEWAGAVARGATIKYVVSKSTNSTDGVDLSAMYAVNNNLAPVLSVSFGLCEFDMGFTHREFYNNLWAQAAAQGISVFVASGDSGAATCDRADASYAARGLRVSGYASTPYNVAVGGTQFDDTSGSYWSSSNDRYGASARGYIPEVAWNESGSVPGGRSLWAGGGGQSAYYAKPVWQVAPGVTDDGRRDLPDVALNASLRVGYWVASQGTFSLFGGTSAATPAFAGIMALVLQKAGERQGNPNPRLYQLGNAQYLTGAPQVFHDVTRGHNAVPGSGGYVATPGYDVVTGLGSVDAAALVNNWANGVNGVGGNASCSYRLAAASLSLGTSAAFAGEVAVTAPAGCAWTAASDTDWLRVTAGATRSGSGSVAYAVAANTGSQARSGSFTIAGQAYTIYQPATSSPCSFTLAGSSASFTAGQASSNVNLATADGCNWTATSNADWISITSSAAQVGSGAVLYTLAANTSPLSRVGTLTLAGQFFTITQAGTPNCSYGLNFGFATGSARGGRFSVGVFAPAGCAWITVSHVPWLSVTAGATGVGNATVTVQVAASPSTSTRMGTLTLAGIAFPVTQGPVNAYVSTPADDNFLGVAGVINTAVFTGSATQYVIGFTAGGQVRVQDTVAARDGTDSLFNIQRLQFSDRNVAFDTAAANSAGGIYRLYAAAFGRPPDLAGLGYWVLQADLGQSAAAVAASFVASAEFQRLYPPGSGDGVAGGLDVSAWVSALFLGTLGRAPDVAGLAYYVDQIRAGRRSLAQVLAELADSEEHRARLAAQWQNGLAYLPWRE